MLLIHAPESPPDVPIEQRTSDELTTLIRKLRWMGFDKEAERTQRMLSKVMPAGGVLTASHETD
jgi:hypothetical protein